MTGAPAPPPPEGAIAGGTRQVTGWEITGWEIAGWLVAGCLAVAAPAVAAEAPPLALLRRLYALYPLPPARDPPLLARPEAWLAPPLLALWRRDRAAAAAGQGVGAVDWDPVCACQDDSGLRDIRIAAAPGPAPAVAATVRFTLGGTRQTVAYRLVSTPAGWRIADIATPAVPSLATHLRAARPRRPPG